ncbi:peptide ABC transporter permease [Candidimonas nitroreducens]|uniref:Peptide ABC transporter permease n=2 Tax=Candidimonas nitroreducens TaxID=683354 RepID=A0A225N1C6_9BURK|nr:peptide ABC transporter permease [Candidimonas nitroreducens]
MVGVAIVLAVIVAAVAAPYLSPADPLAQNLSHRLLPPFWEKLGSTAHFLGTDQLGRDVLARLLYGARITLLVGFVCTFIAGTVGTMLGIIAAYIGGRVDALIMRLADIQLSLPFIILAIALVAALGPSLFNIIIVLGLTSWVRFARVVRAETLVVRELNYIEAAHALGAGAWRIVRHHILPNVASPIIVVATLEIPRLILMEASLSFLGLGVQPPTPSWGSMVSEGRSYLDVAWWLTTVPGLAITVVVLSVNLVGDWLRDSLDVRM